MVNRILDSLTRADAGSLRPHLELVPLELNAVLCEEGVTMNHVYFPVSGIISLVTRIGRTSVESATVGSEGMLGLALFLGAGASHCKCIVRIRGEAWRLPATAFCDLVESSPAFSASLKRYTATRLRVAYRSAGCSLLHALASRSARWLLFVHDRVPGDQFELTHACLAEMLGVRRAGVTTALGAFQRDGVISSRRGRMTILDRERLEAEACECNAIIRSHYDSRF
jgi:CRP-like cAMP-binding protein